MKNRVMQIQEFNTAFPDLLQVFSNKNLLHYTDLDYCEDLQNSSLNDWVSDSNRLSLAGYEDGEFVGFVSAHLVKKHLTASVTVVILEKFQKQGFAKLLLQELIIRLVSMGYERIEAQVCTENDSSKKTFESLGFECEGVLRNNFMIDNVLRDSFMFAKIAESID